MAKKQKKERNKIIAGLKETVAFAQQQPQTGWWVRFTGCNSP